MDAKRLRRLQQTVFVALAGLALVALLAGGFAPLQRASFDSLMQAARHFGALPANDAIVVVALDEKFIEDTPEPIGLYHPYLGALLTAIAQGGPKVTALDMLLPTRSFDGYQPPPEVAALHPPGAAPADYHASLAAGLAALSGQSPVFIGRSWDPRNKNFLLPHQDFITAAQMERVLAGEAPRLPASSILCPEADDVIRSFPGVGCQPTSSDPQQPTLGIAESILQALQRSDPQHLLGQPYLDFGVGEGFAYLPFGTVLDAARKGDAAQMERWFKDRIVLVGAVLDFEDRKLAPLPLLTSEPGVTLVPGALLHAQAVRTVLADRLLGRPALPVVALWVLLSLGFWFGAAGPRKTLALFAYMFACTALAWWAYRQQALVLPYLAPVLIAPLSFLLRAVLDALTQRAEKQRLTRLFEGYVSAPVLKKLVDGNISLQPAGSKVYACILFADIRNFTTRSEKAPPEETVGVLNRYLGEMTDAIQGAGGCIDKFIGDGIMALFGAPEPLENPDAAAIRASLDMLARLERLNAQFAAEGVEPLKIGIGLNSGEVIVGSIGSEKRLEFTAIGDVVNTASRLEGLTKGAGYPIVVSEAVAKASGADNLHPLGAMEVKGRAAVVVFGLDPAKTVSSAPDSTEPVSH